jgi:hypothetical protein
MKVQVVRIILIISGKALLDGTSIEKLLASVSVAGLWRG